MKISAVFGLSCAISVAALPELASKFVQNRRSLKRARPSSLAPLKSLRGGSSSSSSSSSSFLGSVTEPFGIGLQRDLTNFKVTYVSHVTDGACIKVVSATAFLVFGCLAPAVAFGALCDKATHGAMGTVEMVLGTALSGMAYALLAGQPLTIVGSTGPVLAFISALYKLAKLADLPFLPVYAWTGLWTSGFLTLYSLYSLSLGSAKYLSRFTDEIFANLISFIFIYEACQGLAAPLLNSKNDNPAAALMAIHVATVTFGVAASLLQLRHSALRPKRLRSLLADFAPTVGVACGCALAWWAQTRWPQLLQLPRLAVPLVLEPTSGRPWLVELAALPVWARWAAAVPAAMVSVLLFFDQTITTRIVNGKGNRLRKGHGDHLDLLVLALLTGIQSLIGLPWLCAATVRSINHVKALHVYAPNNNNNNEKHGSNTNSHNSGAKATSLADSHSSVSVPSTSPAATVAVVGTVEQRVSGFLIHAIIGLVVVAYRPLLRAVPKPALSGLFFYLGQSALRGNQMFERCVALFTDPAMDPPGKPWARQGSSATHPSGELSSSSSSSSSNRSFGDHIGDGLPPATVRAYTLVQVACLASLVAIKDTDAGVLFPIVVAGLAPVRCALPAIGSAMSRIHSTILRHSQGPTAADGRLAVIGPRNIFEPSLVARLDQDDE